MDTESDNSFHLNLWIVSSEYLIIAIIAIILGLQSTQ